MIFVPRNASEEQVLDIVREWVQVLARGDYEFIFAELGYSLTFGEPGAECIRNEIKKYRSPEYFPEIEEFMVSDWKTARGGYAAHKQKVIWYKQNSVGLAGAVEFDLPLNGKWSDLKADFVFFDNKKLKEGYVLALEQIQSNAQWQREVEHL